MGEGWDSDEASNLLALCPNCHSLHTAGVIPDSAIRQWKWLLVALNQAFDRESVDLLLFPHRAGALADELRGPMPYSADGLLKFARLVAARLVRFGLLHGNVGTAARLYHVELTDRGARFLEAWLEGDEEKYRRMLAESAPGLADDD